MSHPNNEKVVIPTVNSTSAGYEDMSIDQLAEKVESFLNDKNRLLPMIEIKFEAESRHPRVPAVFETQAQQLEGIIETTRNVIEQSRLSDTATKPSRMGMGY